MILGKTKSSPKFNKKTWTPANFEKSKLFTQTTTQKQDHGNNPFRKDKGKFQQTTSHEEIV